MGFTLENIKLFLDDHPDLFGEQKDGILDTFRAQTDHGLVSTGQIEKTFGKHFPLFIKETRSLPKHIEIGTNALMRSRT